MTTGDARTAAARVELLLERLRAGPDPRAGALAEELVRCLVQLYGAGLERIVATVGPDACRVLVADPLVESLLLIHDLHPDDAGTRIRRALDRLAVTVDRIEVDDGVARIRVHAGHGCHSWTDAVRASVESAVRDAAPELTGIEVARAAEPVPLLQISRRHAS